MAPHVVPASSPQGYYRYPTLHGERIIFACEDDLWSVSLDKDFGGMARRLTSGLAECSSPAFSPDGSLVAFTGREEGQPEIYVMPSGGGGIRRLTYLGGNSTRVLGWHGQDIIFTTNAAQGFLYHQELCRISPNGGNVESLKLGHGVSISFTEDSSAENAPAKILIGRNAADAARWKRYKGGTAGDIWIDADGSGNFTRLNRAMKLKGNLVAPMWIETPGGMRVYFVSDHEGVANLYSVLPDGSDLVRHTHHTEYFVRYPQRDASATHGKSRRIVYHAGADIFLFDAASNTSTKIDIAFHSPQTQRQRKFISADHFLEDYFLHPNGHSLAVTARGKAFAMPANEGAVVQLGELPERKGIRYRLAQYLSDGNRLAVISDSSGEERLEVWTTDNKAVASFPDLDTGRALLMLASPKKNEVLISNHRQELLLINIDAHSMTTVDTSVANRIESAAWSPDGRFIAYSFPVTAAKAPIKIYDTLTGKSLAVTEPLLYDFAPSFDAEGKYLYFLSQRVFDPVYDSLHFDLNFPKGIKPYLLTLRKDLMSPFMLDPKSPAERKLGAAASKGNGKEDGATGANPVGAASDTVSGSLSGNAGNPDRREQGVDEAPEVNVEIDFDGITHRILEFPVPEARYAALEAGNGKVFFLHFPIEGAMSLARTPVPINGTLDAFSFAEKKSEVIAADVTDFKLSLDRRTLIRRSGHKLTLTAADEPALLSALRKEEIKPLDLSRLKVSIEPPLEWKQMYREAWRLQRDHFWTPDMSGVDWQQVYERYLPLLSRIGSRSEFSDLMWEMQGELGTSHCYERGGDYRLEPKYPQGSLGADTAFDEVTGAYKILYLPAGDTWEDGKDSPLRAPGVGAKQGDLILAINGQRVSAESPLGELLVNQAGTDISITLADADKSGERTVRIKTLRDEQMLRYRDWVNRNTAHVHAATGGKVGYVHVPNMGPWGYSEFHRAYLTESAYESLIVDVRFNGGGHVSQLLLEKLARKRLGYDISRWSQAPEPYPSYSVLGPIVALTNEFAGSDGDIFSHCFKLMKLGTLIGKRTWGGVVGIYPRHPLADGSVTTQPEFSFWFKDVGWSVENYGTDPDIEVDMTPSDYGAGRDTQLDRAIAEVLAEMHASPPALPAFPVRPNLALPKLPAA